MTTEKQKAANRANATKSTGPKTRRGKAKSSLNALTHGATATTLVLPGEDENKLSQLRAALIADCAPQNPFEAEQVEQLLQIAWRARRVPAFEKALLHWLHVQEDRMDSDREWMNTLEPRSQFERKRHPEEGMIPSYAVGAERQSFELGRILAVAMDSDYLSKLSRYEAHLLRQFRQLRDDIEESRKRRDASTKKKQAPPTGKVA